MSQSVSTTDYPRSWDWDKEGERVEGAFVELGEGPTVNGLQPIAVLEVDGEHRSIWLFHEALRSKFRAELERRAGGDFDEGEPVVIERRGWREGASGRRYVDYFVAFPAAPRRSAAEILGVGAVVEDHEAEGDEPAPF